METANQILYQIRLFTTGKFVLIIPALLFAFIIFDIVKFFSAEKRTPIRVTFRQRYSDPEPGQLLHVIRVNAILAIRIFVAILILSIILLNFTSDIFFPIFFLALAAIHLQTLSKKILIYDNAIQYKTLFKKKTVLFKDLDYMDNSDIIGVFRDYPNGYKFVKGNDIVFYFKSAEFQHPERLEEIFRENHPCVEKFEENPGSIPC